MTPFYKNPIFYLPDGPANLAPLVPTVDWTKVEQYYVELKDQDGTVILRTPIIRPGCCCVEDKARVYFMTSLGAIDAVNFMPPVISEKVSSSEYRKSVNYPLAKSDTGAERFNVRSTETWDVLTTCYEEPAQNWLAELLRSPKAWIYVAPDQGQPADYAAIKVLDGQMTKRKAVDRFIYEFRLSFVMANDFTVQRN